MNYADEKAESWTGAWIEARQGDLLMRDPRMLHGGTPNKMKLARSMVTALAYNKLATDTYPDLYVPFDPEAASSLPRYAKHDPAKAVDWHRQSIKDYGNMKTI